MLSFPDTSLEATILLKSSWSSRNSGFTKLRHAPYDLSIVNTFSYWFRYCWACSFLLELSLVIFPGTCLPESVSIKSMIPRPLVEIRSPQMSCPKTPLRVMDPRNLEMCALGLVTSPPIRISLGRP